MKLVISDATNTNLNIEGANVLIENNGIIKPCRGCFACWIKTPGKCIIADGYEEMGKLLSQCTELIIVSECIYGSVSPFVKNVMDRSIPYIHPNFSIRNGEMHHKRRYSNIIKISSYFYGENITDAEKMTASKLIQANAVNFDGEAGQIEFLNNKCDLEEISL